MLNIRKSAEAMLTPTDILETIIYHNWTELLKRGTLTEREMYFKLQWAGFIQCCEGSGFEGNVTDSVMQ